ncbi:MAG: hypothetical protein KGI60_02905 [Patescibacteria group bacterium]|nr:hypothetical protein [Patescibacteria group bacterium]
MATIEETKAGGERSFNRSQAVALAIISVLAGLALAWVVLNWGGATRNCVKSALGNLPECNDGPGGNGTPLPTTVNGQSIGTCRNVTAAGTCIP